MIKINKKALLTSILMVAVLASSWIFAQEARAERAMWVWGMAEDIVLDATAKQAFFDFCAAPHGDSSKAITMIFFDAKPYGLDLMTHNSGSNLRQFLVDAHANGLKVEFLSGDRLWATPDHRSEGESLIDEVTAFNAAGAVNQRFDGIHYDVEPYLLDTQDGDPLDWDYDKTLIWDTYKTLLTNCQSKVNTYNASYDPDIRFGVDIPYWYTLGSTPGPQEVLAIVDYIGVMDYRDDGANLVSGAQDEIDYANGLGKKVYVGVETSFPTDAVDFPPSSTFYEEGYTAMESALGDVETAFSGYSSYAGIAVHYYEDLTGPRGYERAYRGLPAGATANHVPHVAVISPTDVGEVWSGTVNIQWEASDLDGETLTISIQIKREGDADWSNIATGETNDGSYAFNASAYPSATDYRIRVNASDGTITGYDISNNTFEITTGLVETNITDLHLWNVDSSSLRLIWTAPSYTPAHYAIYRSENGSNFMLLNSNAIATNNYLDTGLNSSSKYKYKITAIYGTGQEGNDSNISNTLIPGSTFLIDYCEQEEEVTYNKYGTSTLNYSLNASDVKEGSRSLRLDYTYAGSGWGAVLVGTLPAVINVSPYKSVAFWAKGGTVDGTAIALQLTESGAPDGDETWQSEAVFIQNTDWTEYQFNFSNFTRTSAAGNNRLDLTSIGSYALFFNGGNTPNGTYRVDQIRLLKSEGSIGTPSGDYSFGTVSGSANNHRFRVGPIPISYAGFDPPWTVRIYTRNGVGVAQAGLKGADGTTYIPLKVWCGNFGPTSSVPDEENDYFWAGYDFNGDGDRNDTVSSVNEANVGFDVNGDGDANDVVSNVSERTKWARIPEDDEMSPTNVYTWRRLSWNSGGVDASLGSPFDIYLGIDVYMVKNQQYQTTTLTVEYLPE